MYVLIDPVLPSKSDSFLLKTLFLSNHKRSFIWEKNVPYDIIYQDRPFSIVLSSTIVKRASKKNHPRYEVIRNRGNSLLQKKGKTDEPLGEGGFAVVYPVDHTLKIKHGELIHKHPAPGQARVAKIFNVSMQPSKRNQSIKDAHHEYLMESNTFHLHPKMPVMNHRHIINILRYVQGSELFQVQNNDIQAIGVQARLPKLNSAKSLALFEKKHKSNILSLEQRFEFSLLLLKALKKQVFDAGMIHRDLKPENIFIDLQNKQVAIIDYGLARMNVPSSTSEPSAGTPGFISPEALHDPRFLALRHQRFFKGKTINKDKTINGTTQLSDVYSMGRVLTLFWGLGDMTSYDYAIDGPSHAQYGFTNDYSTLFDLIPKDQRDRMNSRAAAIVKTTLQKMTAYLPEDRIPLEEAICAFTQANDLQEPQISKHKKAIAAAKNFSFKTNLTHFSPPPHGSSESDNDAPYAVRKANSLLPTIS